MPPPSAVRSQRCVYCRVLLAPAGSVWHPDRESEEERRYEDESAPRFWIDGHRYVLSGRLARGEGTDVFLGWREHALKARVVAKVLRARGAEERMRHEERVLEMLGSSSAQGAGHFSRLLPERVAFGRARLGAHGGGGERLVALRRFRPGFVHTLGEVRRAHRDTLEPAHVVWMWKRVLESLGFVHASGLVHGAVLPAHLLVNAKDHGVVLAGFSRAVRPGERLPARTLGADDFYPDDVLAGGPASVKTDLAMSARAMLYLLGGDARKAPARVPAPFARLLETTAVTPWASDAWALVEDASHVARDVFGPPRFVPLAMPD